jgi:hypothetical protein
MTIEHYLVTLYMIVGILISFHYRTVEKEDSIFWVVFTGIIWPIYVVFYVIYVIYGFLGADE